MSGNGLDEEVKAVFEELPALVGKADKWLATLRKKWQDNCHPGWWSDVLYFEFTKATKKAK